jgi:hypothetical protein
MRRLILCFLMAASCEGPHPGISRADTQARLQSRRLRAVIRKYIPGFENAYVIDSSPTVEMPQAASSSPPGATCGDSRCWWRRVVTYYADSGCITIFR